MIALLLARELTTSLRRTGFHVLITAQAVAALALVFAADAVVRQLTPNSPPSLGQTITALTTGSTQPSPAGSPPSGVLASSVDTALLLGWGLWLVLACAVAVPALVGGAIARERERGTLAVMLGSGATPGALVAAKLANAVLLTAGIVASGLPALALALVFGSPPIGAVAACALVVLAWGGLLAGLGIAASSMTRGSAAGITAALIAETVLVLVIAVIPAAAASLGVSLPDFVFRLNPLSAVMLAEPGTGQQIVEQVASGPWLAAFSAGAPPGPGWWPFVAASLLGCALLCGASSLVLVRSTSDN